MPDEPAPNAPNQDGNQTSEPTSDAGGEFKPITSQDDLNRIISDRVNRERGKFSDYKDLKSKASRLDELEAANKSEIEKAADRVATAERDRDSARTEALRLRVATKFGISDEDADLFLVGTDEETLTKQAERLSQRSEDRKRQGNHVPREGSNPGAGANDDASFARGLLGGAD